jgi:hypothetical protein
MERRPFPNLRRRKPVRREPPWFNPKWNDVHSYRRWAEHFVEKNHWRVTHLFPEKEDALQECAAIFFHCHRKYYGPRVDNAAWFMSLYKRAVINKFNKYAIADQNKYRAIIDDNTTVSAIESGFHGWEEHEYYDPDHHTIEPWEEPSAHFIVALNDMPSEVKLVLNRLLEAPNELRTWLFRRPRPAHDLPKPDPALWMKSVDRRLHRVFSIPYGPNGETYNIVERLRDLVGLRP